MLKNRLGDYAIVTRDEDPDPLIFCPPYPVLFSTVRIRILPVTTYLNYGYIFFFISIKGRIRRFDPDPWKKM